MDDAPSAGPPGLSLLRLMRPSQWTKNLLVGAAFFFAYFDRARLHPLAPADGWRVVPAVLLFCLVSSGIYALNDVLDRDSDRRHPVKRHRPVAAGRVSVPAACALAAALIALGGAGAALLSLRFAGILGAYVAIQLVYTLWLKRVALVDTMVIAAGFVLRAIAGALVFPDVSISPWLLLCTFFLALFLGLCKRRHEKGLGAGAEDHRPSLEHYDRELLDQLIGIASSATIVAYAIYTQWPDTVSKFGTHGLGFTVPFVAFGVFRYLDLVYRKEQGDRPEKILLTDLPLLAAIALYGVTAVAVFALR